MHPLIQKILARKFLSFFILILVIGGGYWIYHAAVGSKTTTRYITAAADKGTLIVSVGSSGQVSSLNQFDVKPKVSGDVMAIPVVEGQTVKSGTVLVKLDTTDAEKTLRDAQANLASSKLSLAKLIQPADALSILQAQNSLAQAQQSKQQAVDALKKAYDNGFNAVADAFLDLPGTMNGLHTMLYASNANLGAGGQWVIDYYTDIAKQYDSNATQYRNDAYAKYQAASLAYDQNFTDYKSTSRFADPAVIESLVTETYNTTKLLAEAITSSNNLVQFYEDKLIANGLKPQSLADTQIATLNTYTGKLSTDLGVLLGITQTIQDSKNSSLNADQSIADKTQSLAKLQNGPDPLDVQSAQLSVTQKENALLDAQEKLADYSIRAPFDGVVAKINVKKGEPASSGSAVVTFVTQQKLALVTLNEVDVAKVKVGQKVTLTFDAIPELNITGEISIVDSIGTITQGVVTYGVTISFDTQDERVRSGMSVSAAIITDVKTDALLVPNSAVKTNSAGKYVQILVNGAPNTVTVETGLANDTMTEIISGLNVGDTVITRTVTGTTAAPSANSSGIRIPGITGGGGGGANRGGAGRIGG